MSGSWCKAYGSDYLNLLTTTMSCLSKIVSWLFIFEGVYLISACPDLCLTCVAQILSALTDLYNDASVYGLGQLALEWPSASHQHSLNKAHTLL